MKGIKLVFLILLGIGLNLPILTFNTQLNYVSAIDNRELTELTAESGDVTNMIDNYIKDRIGFRENSIDRYTELNDRLFNLMIHPTYTYGKDGYVFFKMSQESVDTEFIDAFCAYLRKVQDYCKERGVPFIYCLNPSKITVYEQYLPKGYHYRNAFNKAMVQALERYEVNYISNESLLKEKSKTEQVYNVKFDAGHWNDLGAFYGTNHILSKVQEEFPDVQLLKKGDFEISEITETSLPVSHFEINEKVPLFEDKNAENIKNITAEYDGISLDTNYRALFCLVNMEDGAEKLPRVLGFQGSYYNSRTKFFESAFQEYDGIHNYQNFINFDYYFNIFQPDCVILETAEYATNRGYFSYEKLLEKQLNPELAKEDFSKAVPIESLNPRIKTDGALVTIRVDAPEDAKRGYLLIGDRQFDFALSGKNNVARCTIDKRYYQDENVRVLFE